MRDRFLRAVVLAGAAVWLITELLSGFDAVRRAPLMVCWALALGAIAVALRRRPVDWAWPRFDWLVAACCGGCAAVLILTAVTAGFSPPNSADAMAYHMPRVLYWAEQGSVRFFPTHYLNQIMLQPFAEYAMLQSYVVTGGDRFINFGQWIASAVSVIAVSAIAKELGAPARGQALAALFCATIPAGVLASSGAKNDYVLAMWLAACVYFALRWRAADRLEDALSLGCALGLALLTKATAYLFAPWPLVAILIWKRKAPVKACVAVLACVFAINAPQYWRNWRLTGSVLGSESAFGDDRYRWPNDSFGWKQTVSNALRNASEQLGARSEAWNRGVYNFVAWAHGAIGAGLNDAATTWPGAEYAPPRNANHEADAPNRLHLAILLAVSCVLAWRAVRGGERERAVYVVSLLFGFLAFCAYLKWQPFMARMFLPLFVLGAPLVSMAARRWWVQAVLCILLLDAARRPALENWVRPLRGEHSVLKTPRDAQYFADMTQWREDLPAYGATVNEIEKSGCETVGVDVANFQLEYPLEALLKQRNPRVEFIHTGVENASARYKQPVDAPPCAVVCLHCAGDAHRLGLYREFPKVVMEGNFAVLKR